MVRFSFRTCARFYRL